jgi:hypothetical protein
MVYEGSIIKKTQSHYTWQFMIGQKSKKVELITNAMGRKRILVDSNLIFDENTGMIGGTFQHKFISENCNMTVFLNEGNQYDMSVDGMKFSTLYNQQHGGGPVPQNVQSTMESQTQAPKPFEQAGPVQDFGFSFNPGNSSQNRNPEVSQNQSHTTTAPSVRYENPDRIFTSGSDMGDFKFDGFGKDAWGIYSAGLENHQQQKPGDFFANPFDKGVHQSPAELFPQSDEGNGGMWNRDAPIAPQVVEDSSKSKKRFHVLVWRQEERRHR